ncbi:MAG TPA: HPF/RaiA family ribosome-associated protein [Coleofasciculaceae cyanobacterium]
MQLTPQITLRNISPSAAIEDDIRKHTAKLNEFYDRIMDCRVMVEAPHQHHHKGNLYHVRIDLTVPGGELVINRGSPQHQAHEDLYVTIRDAFESAEHELRQYAERQRGDVKTHAVPPHGRIANLLLDEGYGFIEAADGHQVYFHQNSLINADFSQLKIGQEVRFAEEEGDEGLQASTVRLIGKHHLIGN